MDSVGEGVHSRVVSLHSVCNLEPRGVYSSEEFIQEHDITGASELIPKDRQVIQKVEFCQQCNATHFRSKV